jgi:asparagine synthase (glutamine-hydrolysing)
MDLIQDRGFAALTRSAPGPALTEVLAATGVLDAQVVRGDAVETATWGLAPLALEDPAALLCTAARRHETDLTLTDVRTLLLEDVTGLGQVMPTFAAAAWASPSRVVAAADALGFRHLFLGEGPGWAMLSTSSKAPAAVSGARLDREALAIQSLLGWQLGQRSIFDGVRKLDPGCRVALGGGRAQICDYLSAPRPASIGIDEAVAEAAEMLRTYLVGYLDDHPDAGLQLTGGQDSRLLLSAIPPARRRGLRVVTLGLPGVPDVDIAAGFARRYGMDHEILSLDGLEQLDPADAERLCLAAARRLDYTTDPLAHAVLTYAESRSTPGPRISGLGGEVARGFYYLGPPTDAPVSARRAQRLASWRMFLNEAVPGGALEPGFSGWARGFGLDEVERVLVATGRSWMAATDELYLGHRMQRWGGATETAVCLERPVVNPMLDDRFVAVANGLTPRDKRGSCFLGRLQLELDDELGHVPLEGRPSPFAYATRSPRSSARLATATAGKLRRKVLQRVRHGNRPPAGSEILAGKLVARWRESSAVLEPVTALGVFRTEWIDGVVNGRVEPSPAALAMLVNLVAATE